MKRKKDYNKKYYMLHPWRKVYDRTKFKCIYDEKYTKNRIKCLLTCEDMKFLWFRDKAFLMKKPSIDRMDSSGNYTLKNCRFIEQRLNSALKRSNKINFKIAQEIRQLLKQGKRAVDLARRFKIKACFVSNIKHNLWYKPETYLTQIH